MSISPAEVVTEEWQGEGVGAARCSVDQASINEPPKQHVVTHELREVAAELTDANSSGLASHRLQNALLGRSRCLEAIVKKGEVEFVEQGWLDPPEVDRRHVRSRHTSAPVFASRQWSFAFFNHRVVSMRRASSSSTTSTVRGALIDAGARLIRGELSSSDIAESTRIQTGALLRQSPLRNDRRGPRENQRRSRQRERRQVLPERHGACDHGDEGLEQRQGRHVGRRQIA